MTAFGVCVGDWDRLRANVLPHAAGRPVIAVSGQTSIAVAYNAILEAAEWMTDLDLLIIQHDDLEITDPNCETKFQAAADAGADVMGVAGGRGCTSIAWWNLDPIGHQRTDAMTIDWGVRAGPVELLEGSLLAFTRRACALRFDTTYPGFHGYDADICMQARDQDLGVAVVDVDTHHHNPMGFKTAESHLDWLAADRRFRQKWEVAR